MATQVFDADDPRVLSGEFDIWGYRPKERRAQAKRIQAAKARLQQALDERRAQAVDPAAPVPTPLVDLRDAYTGWELFREDA